VTVDHCSRRLDPFVPLFERHAVATVMLGVSMLFNEAY